jgi:hypothetical protein
MARNLQPRSALTPPRSPAPINATRPDFPVRAGQFLGGTHPPTRTDPVRQPPAWQFFGDQELAFLVFRGSGL